MHKNTMVPPRVHNVRFYDLKCLPIYFMCLNKPQKLLAVSRSNASLEIWNLQGAAFIERTIPSISTNYSIEGMAWYGERLFSVGLHGFLIEYDLLGLTIKNRWALTGQSAFCIDVSLANHQLAIGTELGYVNVYSIEDNDVVFERLLDKQDSRVMCLKYDPSGRYLVGGGQDAIRVWSVKTGHALQRMTTGRTSINNETIVWSVAVTDNLTIISGDSRGRITFWDGNLGSQLESYQTHKFDILTVCLSDDQKKFYCAGVDPMIASYELTSVTEKSKKWVKSVNRAYHDHDVRAMVLLGDRLFSAGEDGYLCCSYFPPKTLVRLPPLLQGRRFAVPAVKARYLLLRYPDYIEVWTLCRKGHIKSYNPIEDKPCKLLTLARQVKDDRGRKFNEGIIAADINQLGNFIAYSTDSLVRLFKFEYFQQTKQPALCPMDLPASITAGVVNLKFTAEDQLLLVTRDQKLIMLNLIDLSISQIEPLEKHLSDVCTFMEISADDRFVVLGDPRGKIAVWEKQNASLSYHCDLPTYSAPVTCMAIQDDENALICTYCDHTVIKYSLDKKRLLMHSNYAERSTSKFWNNKLVATRNIVFEKGDSDVMALCDDSHISTIKISNDEPKRKSKMSKSTADDLPCVKILKVNRNYNHLAFFGYLDKNELISVEVKPDMMKEMLPPSFKSQHGFGNK